MPITKRSDWDKERGYALSQYMAGAIGSMLTTLPCFIIIPIWAIFIHNYQILDKDGKEDNFACGAICFYAGIKLWMIAGVIYAQTR